MSNKKLDKLIERLKEKKKDKKVPMSFKIEKYLSDKLDTISKENSLSKTELVEEILKDYLS